MSPERSVTYVSERTPPLARSYHRRQGAFWGASEKIKLLPRGFERYRLIAEIDFRFARYAAAGSTEPPNRALSMFGLLDYRGWPRRRLHSPRAERMKVRPPSPPSAQSVQTKKKPPVDLAISP